MYKGEMLQNVTNETSVFTSRKAFAYIIVSVIVVYVLASILTSDWSISLLGGH